MRRYHVENNDYTFNPDGDWVRYDDAKEAIQDQLDKLHRIQQVAQVAYDHWPHDAFLPAIVTILQICKDGTASPITAATGVERRVCQDIAKRQKKGIAKYGTTLEDNPLRLREWLQHTYEELLDAALYARRAMEELDK